MTDICIAHGGDVSQPSGGTDRVVAFASRLERFGFDVTMVIPSPDQELPQALSSVEMETVEVPSEGVWNQPLRALRIAGRAKRIAREENAHIQFEHSTLGGTGALVGCSDYTLDMHDLAYPSPLYSDLPLGTMVQGVIKRIERRAVNLASNIVVVSTPIKKVLVQEWEVPESKVVVIPNGYSERKLNPFENGNEISGRVGFIGTIHSKLDFQSFIETARLQEVETVQIIGGGGSVQQLRELVEQADVDVVLNGHLPHEEAYELLSTCEVTIYPVCPSKHAEMLVSRKIFDYAALEKSMVLTDVSESRVWERFKENDAALFAPPRSPEEFRRKVGVLIADDGLRNRIAGNAKELVREYTWDRQVKALRNTYQQRMSNR